MHGLHPLSSSLPLRRSRSQCVEDWVEIFQIYRDNSEELVGRYCKGSAPGPVVSMREVSVGLKIFLHTNEKDVYSGFHGNYKFFDEKSIFGDGEHWALTMELYTAVFYPRGR